MSGSVPGLCPLAADTALCSDSHACLRTLPGVPVGPRHARRGLVRELAAIGCLPLQLSTSPIESILFLTPNLFLPVVNGSVTHPTDCSHGKTWEPPWTAPPPSPASGQSALRLLNSTSLDLDPVPVTHSPPPPARVATSLQDCCSGSSAEAAHLTPSRTLSRRWPDHESCKLQWVES